MEEVVIGRYIIKTARYYYTKEHVWVMVKGSVARIGITDYAQFQIDMAEKVELPNTGDYFESQDVISRIEGVKGLFEVLCPLTGLVEQVNYYLEESPTIINEDPYEEGWILELRMSDPLEIEDLLSPEDYIEYVQELAREESGSNVQVLNPETLEEESIEEISEDELGYEEH